MNAFGSINVGFAGWCVESYQMTDLSWRWRLYRDGHSGVTEASGHGYPTRESADVSALAALVALVTLRKMEGVE